MAAIKSIIAFLLVSSIPCSSAERSSLPLYLNAAGFDDCLVISFSPELYDDLGGPIVQLTGEKANSTANISRPNVTPSTTTPTTHTISSKRKSTSHVVRNRCTVERQNCMQGRTRKTHETQPKTASENANRATKQKFGVETRLTMS